MKAAERCRFAPSTTGLAHPGTLLAALLAWLDARSRQAHLTLRLEDIDKERCRPAFGDQMQRDLEWLGLDWDATQAQHDHAEQHAAALEELAQAELLYPCGCSRSRIKQHVRRAPDGGFAYPNTCRGRRLPAGGWRAAKEPLRLRLPAGRIEPFDEGGADLAQEPMLAMGDPVVLRRDGAVAYQLAVVVDDGALGVTRIVRGRDIAPSTATQVALQALLGLPTPTYRHHLLLLEPRGGKLAKLHGSVGAPELRRHYAPEALVGTLAAAAGLLAKAEPLTPAALLPLFDWRRVRSEDRVVAWSGERLVVNDSTAAR
jgi:glutamyl-Q tRNA(Asp) synthetase